MNRKKTILLIDAIIAVAVVVSLFAFLTRKSVTDIPAQQSTAETVKPATGVVTVTYDSNGFSPKEIVIAKGATVSFDNKTEIPMWVASDPHPEHFDYPEFDVIRVNGQYPEPRNDFRFTFDKPGIWTYHNHTMPGDIGKVTVQ